MPFKSKKPKKQSPKLSYREENRIINGQKVVVKIYDPFCEEQDTNPARPMYIRNKTMSSSSSGNGSSIKYSNN